MDDKHIEDANLQLVIQGNELYMAIHEFVLMYRVCQLLLLRLVSSAPPDF